ncbi:hypothetical protein KQX54_011068 [Cotesia glomerata]|uniref:Uncharacterized protein n=1 Tax=Cotesia glomerata TaxID=32391 RepID=A0AAV7IS01_COTGL|nr:hypothetical protein KQX54_011068 [Cotesia glomerata]
MIQYEPKKDVSLAAYDAFYENIIVLRKSGWPNTVNGVEIYEGTLKRNIDEIDRTGFDNFVKRNFDEIDRSGWDSFVKRRIANAYFSGRQH